MDAMTTAGTPSPLELNALLGVSPLINPPRRSPRLAKRELEPKSAVYPLFTSYTALVPAVLMQKPLEGPPPAKLGVPFNVKITRRRTNVAKVPWDPDDFAFKRQQTWAPPMPRRRPLRGEHGMPPEPQQKRTKMGGGSFKQRVDSERSDASPHLSPAVGAKEEVAAERSHEGSPLCDVIAHARPNKRTKTSIVHTDPTHKRDVVIRDPAFGWGARGA